MKIEKFDMKRLRNGEHFQFHTKVTNQVIKYTAATLGITDAFAAYQVVFGHEGEAFVLIQKSAITKLINQADELRDALGRGLIHTFMGATYHYNDEVKQAALRLQVVFDHFGNFMEEPNDEESADITNMVNTLNTDHAADVATVGLSGWLDALITANNKFIALGSDRNAEGATKTVYRMKTSRKEVDAAYLEMINRVNALVIINGEGVYKDFINELNLEVANQKLKIAQRKGRNSSDDDEEEDSTDSTDTTPSA